MKYVLKVIPKIFWLLFIALSCTALCSITYPLAISVINTLIGDHPVVVETVQYTWVFLGAVYGIYLKKIRNDDRRRAYLIKTRRIYPGFWKDMQNTAKTSDFILFTVAFVVLLLLALFLGWQPATPILPLGLWNTGLVLVGALLFAAAYLLMENRVHQYWIDILQVPEESEAAASWRRFDRYHMKVYIYQFIFIALFYIFYFINPYLVSIPVCFTPFLFMMYQIHGYNAIKERSDRNKPVKKYLWLQWITAVLYLLTFLFGVFSPRA